MDKLKFILTLVILVVCFEFVNLSIFVISKLYWINDISIIDYKIFLLEIIVFALVAYVINNKRKGKK